MTKYLAAEDVFVPLRNEDGSLQQFTLRIAGKLHRCKCGCNVFHKPDRHNLSVYECNGCEQQFETEPHDHQT